jgi:hypothetical protein
MRFLLLYKERRNRLRVNPAADSPLYNALTPVEQQEFDQEFADVHMVTKPYLTLDPSLVDLLNYFQPDQALYINKVQNEDFPFPKHICPLLSLLEAQKRGLDHSVFWHRLPSSWGTSLRCPQFEE